jgi:uncharacterized ferritin-like protein (DUF455 family)
MPGFDCVRDLTRRVSSADEHLLQIQITCRFRLYRLKDCSMELRSFAKRILESDVIEEKLTPVREELTDLNPGTPEPIDVPARPSALKFAQRRTAPAMPKAVSLSIPQKRAVAHHIMANHELQALEVMARVILAFPNAEPDFRRGLGEIMRDEQRHTRMHIQRAAELGTAFGDYPVNGWIWKKALEYQSTLEYVAGLPLVFEGANLDHTVELEEWFVAAGDRRSAAIMRSIHRDEIRHVRFGIEWLRRWNTAEISDWELWQKSLRWPIRPSRAKGERFQREARLAAGLSPDFIDRLQLWVDEEDPSARE